MATKTSLLSLSKPDYTDAADVAVLNANFDKIDTAAGNGRRVENLLDNSDFYVPINQRGNTSMYYTGSYILDRWSVENQNNDAGGSVSWKTGKVTLTPTAENYISIVQKIGGRYADLDWFWRTLAVQVGTTTDSEAGVWETAQVQLGHETTGVTLPCGLVVYSSGTSVIIRNPAGASPVSIYRVALYNGKFTADTLPAYVYKGYAAELAECQRYYENSWFPNTLGWQNQMPAMHIYGNFIDAFVDFRQVKCSMPTITIHPLNTWDTDAWKYYNGGWKFASGHQVLQREGYRGFCLRMTQGTDDTTTLLMNGAFAVEGHWEASCEP